jgi:23S rRNA pseudouridine1911/1915/1917 synthase
LTEKRRLVVRPQEAGARLDAYLAGAFPDVSRSVAATLVRDGHVTVNGRVQRSSYRVGATDEVAVTVVRQPALSAAPEEMPLDIVYQDPDLAVIDKPAGLVVHPAPGHPAGTLANALAARFPGARAVGDQERPGIVHRLDRDTSGLMVVALTAAAHAHLQRQIAGHEAGRKYLALVTGHLPASEGTIDAPIGRDLRDRKKMATHGAASRSARTSYRVLESLPGFDLLEATLHTGRTHQIRVHFAAAGHPIAGDVTYGGPALPGLHRQFLHAYRLQMESPSTGQVLRFHSPLPEDLTAILEELGTTVPVEIRA